MISHKKLHQFWLKAQPYWQLMRFHKPVGIWLLLWPTVWSLFLAAQGMPSFAILVIFVLGTVLMRAAGCVINDIADRKFDSHVQRTQNRPLTAGKVTLRSAIFLFVALSLIALLLVLQLNRFSILLSFVALFLAVIYPFMKRYIHLPQLILGFAFGWAIPMAYAAIQNHLPPQCWLLFTLTVVWALIYDTEYALVDREDDLKIGIKSSAILFGRYNLLVIACLQTLMICLLIILGITAHLSWFYYLCLVIVTGHFIYQLVLVQSAQYFAAFLNNQWIGLLIFIGVAESFLKLSKMLA